MQKVQLFFVRTGMEFNKATIMRGDTHKIGIFIVEKDQEGAMLRFVCKTNLSEPPLIEKAIQPSVVTENFLKAYFDILPEETSIFPEPLTFIYDLERTINGEVTTLEQGTFSVKLDVAT